MPLQHRPAAIDAPGADAGRDILLETLVEGVALAAVEIQHRRVLRDASEGRAGHALRNAGRRRLRRDARHEGVEVAAAFGGEGGACRDRGADHNGQKKLAHANPLFSDRPDNAMKIGATHIVIASEAKQSMAPVSYTHL